MLAKDTPWNQLGFPAEQSTGQELLRFYFCMKRLPVGLGQPTSANTAMPAMRLCIGGFWGNWHIALPACAASRRRIEHAQR
jgi:hypothetical protein